MTYNTDGIILKYRDIGEHERIYTILTRDHGKIEAWGQGVRKPQSKLSPHLQPLYLCDFMLARGKRFDRIAQVRVENYFAELWGDLLKLSRAVYAAALVDLVLRPGTREKNIFELFLKILDLLKQGSGAPELVFSLKLLKETGFTPQLKNCVMCKREVEGISRPFEAIKGGVLCSQCSHPEATAEGSPANVGNVHAHEILRYAQNDASSIFPVSSITLEVLETLLTGPISSLEMPSQVQKELSDIASAMLEAHFGETPKARGFLETIRQLNLPQNVAV